MKTITDNLTLNPYTAKLFDTYFGKRSFAVFDIETTGLSPAKCKVILSGILLRRGDNCEVIQYFANEVSDEKEIIEKTLEALSSVDYIITYNGKHFDLPFMETRAKKYGLCFQPPVYNLDLFLVIQGHSNLRQTLPNLKQKTVEVFMGLASSRDDEISGGESVALYEQYMQSHAFALEKTILLHNHDDLIQLYKLLPVIAMTDFHRAMYKLGFLAGDMLIQKISFQGRSLCVRGIQRKAPRDYIAFPTSEKPFSLTMDSRSGDFELNIPCTAQAGALFFDAQAILDGNADPIKKYPSVVDGYLIAEDHGIINYMEINAFLLSFFQLLSVPANQ